MPEIGPPSFGSDPPKARTESPGEAQVRLAAWWKSLWMIFGVRFYPFEEEALAKVAGAYIRRWPKLAKWKALNK